MGQVDLGQDQKPGVVGDQMQALKSQVRRAADPGVPDVKLESGSLSAQQSQPLFVTLRAIARVAAAQGVFEEI